MRIEHQEHSFFCFDFDGVILNTVALKAEGFVYAFGDVSETHRSVILEYQLKNGGQDRFKKFSHLSKIIGITETSEDFFETLSARLTEYVLNRIEDVPYIEGFPEFLRKVKALEMPCSIASAMPQAELHVILDRLGIWADFENALGTPLSKQENLSIISNNLLRDNKIGLYFGDTMTDFEAAKNTKLHFVGIGDNPDFEAISVRSVKNFFDIELI